MQDLHRQFELAWADLQESLSKTKLWLYLGWSDIQQRYRGSVLGPLWITLSMTIFIAAISVVYSRLLHSTIGILLPYLAAGMVAWIYVSTVFSKLKITRDIYKRKSIYRKCKTPLFNTSLNYSSA